MRTPATVAALCCLSFAAARPAICAPAHSPAMVAREKAPAAISPVDRVVAVVDEDPILNSDVEQAIGLGFLARKSGEDDPALRRRAVGALIEQRLRFHEVDRFGFTEVPIAEVDEQLKTIRDRFPSDALFQQRLGALGMTENALRQLLARQLMVLTYVEERLGARIFVGLDEIRAYYDTVLTVEMKREGKPAPAIEDVREQIRRVLRERRLNQEIERWTEDLRRQADTTNWIDKVHRELPPIRYEISSQ